MNMKITYEIIKMEMHPGRTFTLIGMSVERKFGKISPDSHRLLMQGVFVTITSKS